MHACYDGVILWSKSVIDPGSTDEVAEFYTLTLVRFLEVLENMSAHQRMSLLAGSQRGDGFCEARREVGLLGDYPDGE